MCEIEKSCKNSVFLPHATTFETEIKRFSRWEVLQILQNVFRPWLHVKKVLQEVQTNNFQRLQFFNLFQTWLRVKQNTKNLQNLFPFHA